MFYLLPSSQVRPSLLTTNKDEEYHIQFARYCLGQANNYKHWDWVNKITKNKNFYNGNQWTDSEDIDSFLKDENNSDRNRLNIVNNVIRPMVTQYRGNAIRMNINYKVKSVSQQVINRREAQLGEMNFYSHIANKEGNPFAAEMKRKLPIGDNEAETGAIFNNIYTDKYIRAMNNLCTFVSQRNHFADLQELIAKELALSGCGVIKTFEYAGHQEFRLIPSENYIFDRSCLKPDHSDATFWGEGYNLFPSEIYEMFPDIESRDREAIDNYSRVFSGQTASINQNTNQISNGRVPVYFMYWRDGQFDEMGYVRDQYGYEYLTKINYTYEGEEKPRYTDADLIKSTSIKAKKLFGDKLKGRLYSDVLRTAVIIPREIIGDSYSEEDAKQGKVFDILLEWGIAPYQETENLEYNSVKSPYKVYCWDYTDGEIASPLDDAIDPQRFINRIWSVSENQINNSRGAGTVYDKDMVGDEAQLLADMNQSKPVGIRTKGLGVQNAIGAYDGTIKGGTTILFNIIDSMKASIQQMTGLNEALKGESTGSDQLVGVTQLMIQRGSLMQEPFYNSITMIYKQCFQSICNIGKRIYCDDERGLAIAVGDESAEVIRITKDMIPEDFRAFVTRENSDEMLRTAADQMLLQFKQLGMMDDKRIANLWGRSTPDEVATALRASASDKEEVARMAQKDQQTKEQALMVQAQQEQKQQKDMMDEATAREDIKHLTTIKADATKEAMKNLGKLAGKNKIADNIILKNAAKADRQVA